MKPADAVKQMNNLVSFNDLLENQTTLATRFLMRFRRKSWKQDETIRCSSSGGRSVEFEDLLEKSDQAGKDVPDEIYNGIIEGKLDPQQAVKQMNE